MTTHRTFLRCRSESYRIFRTKLGSWCGCWSVLSLSMLLTQSTQFVVKFLCTKPAFWCTGLRTCLRMTSTLYRWNHRWNSFPPDLVSHTSMILSWSWVLTWTPKMSAQISLVSDSSIPNATILPVTYLRKWIAQNSTNKKTNLSLNDKKIAVSPSVSSAHRFFTLGSWSTRKSTSSLKYNFSFFCLTRRGPTITGFFPLCLFTSRRCL